MLLFLYGIAIPMWLCLGLVVAVVAVVVTVATLEAAPQERSALEAEPQERLACPFCLADLQSFNLLRLCSDCPQVMCTQCQEHFQGRRVCRSCWLRLMFGFEREPMIE